VPASTQHVTPLTRLICYTECCTPQAAEGYTLHIKQLVVKNAGWQFERLPLNEDGSVKDKSDSPSGEPIPEVLQMRGYTCVHKQSEQFTASAESAAAAAATSAVDKSDSPSGDAPATTTAATAGDGGATDAAAAGTGTTDTTAATAGTAAKADATTAAEPAAAATSTTAAEPAAAATSTTAAAAAAAPETAAAPAATSKVVTIDRPHATEDNKDCKVASAQAGCGAACIIA
jgi:hypothetical protein